MGARSLIWRWLKLDVTYLLVPLVLGVVAYVGYLRVTQEAAVRELTQVELRADSLEAVADSTTFLRTQVTALGDTLEVYQGRLVQVAQARDSLDRALARERRTTALLSVRVDSLTVELSGEVVVANAVADVREVTFQGRLPPYTVAAWAVVPPPPRPADLSLRITLDPIPMSVHVACQKVPGRRVRAAYFEVGVPRWAPVRLDSLSQAPEVCNPSLILPTPGDRRVPWWHVLAASGLFVLGYLTGGT